MTPDAGLRQVLALSRLAASASAVGWTDASIRVPAGGEAQLPSRAACYIRAGERWDDNARLVEAATLYQSGGKA